MKPPLVLDWWDLPKYLVVQANKDAMKVYRIVRNKKKVAIGLNGVEPEEEERLRRDVRGGK
ncbi:MAG: hypothetical protein NTW19_07830 [Planctomycetota bacterium]|nr:hypothetical protein [Planctomycetota bacterium]